MHPKRRITLHAPASIRTEIDTAGALVGTLAGLSGVLVIGDMATFTAPAGSIKLRVLGHDVWLSDLADAVDLKANSEMQAKRIVELEKQHSTISARLSNPGYAQRAPAKLVEESKAQLRAIEDELKVLRG